MNRYLISYGIGALSGVVIESCYSHMNHRCIKNFDLKCISSMTIFNIYGYVTLFTTILLDNCKFNPYLFLPILAIVIASIECIGGQMSNVYHNGVKTWNYDDEFYPACNGYISLSTTLYYTLALSVYAFLIYPYIK